MSNPFEFSEADKVELLLARTFYLSTCIYKEQLPSQNPLDSGPGVTRQYARLAIDALGFDSDALDGLLEINARLYKEATDNIAKIGA